MEVIVGNDMGVNPASVNLDTNVARVNASLFKDLSAAERRLVLLHEAGHVFFDSVDDEALADRFAIEVLAGSEPESLRKSVAGLVSILSACGVPDERLKGIVQTALEIDYERFGNEHAGMLLAELDGRVASMDPMVAGALVNTASQVMSVAVSELMGPRAGWFKGDAGGTRQNEYKNECIRLCTRYYCASLLKNYYVQGEDYIYNRLLNKSRTYSAVHGYLRDYLKDKSMFSRSFANEVNFYKEKNCAWAKKVIDQEVEVQRTWIHKAFVDAGLVPDEDADNNRIWILLIGILAIIYLL